MRIKRQWYGSDLRKRVRITEYYTMYKLAMLYKKIKFVVCHNVLHNIFYFMYLVVHHQNSTWRVIG